MTDCLTGFRIRLLCVLQLGYGKRTVPRIGDFTRRRILQRKETAAADRKIQAPLCLLKACCPKIRLRILHASAVTARPVFFNAAHFRGHQMRKGGEFCAKAVCIDVGDVIAVHIQPILLLTRADGRGVKRHIH